MQTFKFNCPTQNKIFFGAIVAFPSATKVMVELDEPWAGSSTRLLVDVETGNMRTENGSSDFLHVDTQEFPRFQEACCLAAQPEELRRAS